MNFPYYPPFPMERSPDREELIKFYVLNKMTYKYLAALGLSYEAEKFRQTVNSYSVQCLASLPVGDEMLQYVTVQQPPNIDAQLFPTLGNAIIAGSTADTVVIPTASTVGTVTVPWSAGPPTAPTLALAGPPRTINNGASPGNSSMGHNLFPFATAQRRAQFFSATMMPTPRAVGVDDTSMRYLNQQLNSFMFREKLAALVQNHTAIQGSKRARPNTFATVASSTTLPRTSANSSPCTSTIAGCGTTDLSDTSDISSPSISDHVDDCTSDILRLHIAAS